MLRNWATGQFSLAQLFAASEQGVWSDPSDLSTRFQDSAGTTPGVVGQPVGRASDKSGRGNHATQATAADRPTLVDIGGYYGDDFDGATHSLSGTTGGGGTAGFFYCAGLRVDGGAGSFRIIWSDTGANIGYRVFINTSNQLQMQAGNGTAFTDAITVGTLPVGETHVVTAWDDGVNLNVQIDQGAIASVARPVVSAGTAGFTEGKDNGAASSYLNGVLFNRVYRQTAPDAASRYAAQWRCARKAGVVL